MREGDRRRPKVAAKVAAKLPDAASLTRCQPHECLPAFKPAGLQACRHRTRCFLTPRSSGRPSAKYVDGQPIVPAPAYLRLRRQLACCAPPLWRHPPQLVARAAQPALAVQLQPRRSECMCSEAGSWQTGSLKHEAPDSAAAPHRCTSIRHPPAQLPLINTAFRCSCLFQHCMASIAWQSTCPAAPATAALMPCSLPIAHRSQREILHGCVAAADGKAEQHHVGPCWVLHPRLRRHAVQQQHAVAHRDSAVCKSNGQQVGPRRRRRRRRR